MVSRLAALTPKDDLTSIQSFWVRLKVEHKALGVGVVTEPGCGPQAAGWLASTQIPAFLGPPIEFTDHGHSREAPLLTNSLHSVLDGPPLPIPRGLEVDTIPIL